MAVDFNQQLPASLPNVSYVNGQQAPGMSPQMSQSFSSPMALSSPFVSQNVSAPNSVSPPVVSRRDAMTDLFRMGSQGSQVFSAPGALWNQYMAAQHTPGVTGQNVDARAGNMLGATPIRSPLPPVENGSGLAKLIALFGGLAPALTALGGTTISAISRATGGKASSNATGGQGGSANVTNPMPTTPAYYSPYQRQAMNPNFGAYQQSPYSYAPGGLGWTVGGGNLTLGGVLAGYGGSGGGGEYDPASDPWADVNPSPGLTGAVSGQSNYTPYNGGAYMAPQTASPGAYSDSSGGVARFVPSGTLGGGSYGAGINQDLLNRYPNFLQDGRLINGADIWSSGGGAQTPIGLNTTRPWLPNYQNPNPGITYPSTSLQPAYQPVTGPNQSGYNPYNGLAPVSYSAPSFNW